MSSPLPFLDTLPHGVHVIDTGYYRERFDASYLVVEGDRAAFIDTGTNHAVPRLLAALDAVGVSRESVDFVIATHVHLDHAGGAGLLMQSLPQARLVVHPAGARHLVDPSRLMTSATAVYGEETMQSSFGQMVGVPKERVIESEDGMSLELGSRLLQFFHTPGHAKHHHCIWDERSQGFFTGDTFGMSYAEFNGADGPWLFPTTPATQFEPDALRNSVHRLLGFDPQCMYLTHFGAVKQVQHLGTQLLHQLEGVVRLGESLRHHPQRGAALQSGLTDLYLQWLRNRRCALPRDKILELLALDIELNAQGMDFWLG